MNEVDLDQQSDELKKNDKEKSSLQGWAWAVMPITCPQGGQVSMSC